MNIYQQREHALDIVLNKTTSGEYTQVDYDLDEACRDLLGLPDKPHGDLPYVGWMKGEKSESDDHMLPSQGCYNLIKKWEGFSSKAYKCPAGVWTIGYGHTATARQGMSITRVEAELLLQKDVSHFAKAVNNLVTIEVNQNQFDALVSFTYNIGVNAFTNSTLLKNLNSGAYHLAAKQFDRWVYAGQTKLAGLVTRRREERELFGL